MNYIILGCFSQFGYYDENGDVIPLKKRDIYTKDLLGLRDMFIKDQLLFITVPGVQHYDWHLNTSIVDNFILPHLD